MKTHHQHPKLKTQPRPLFSCAFFRHCTQSVLSPTNPHSPSLPDISSSQPQAPPPQQQQPPPQPQPQPQPHQPSSSFSTSSSSSTSQSFTQWRFPLPTSPIHPHPQPEFTPPSDSLPPPPPPPPPPPISSTHLQEIFHVAELQLSTGSDSDQLTALQLLEHSLVPNPPSEPTCPPELMRGLVANLKNNKLRAKPATKVLFALCLAEGNRHVAVESGAVGAVVEVALELDGAAAERALAALELMCTLAEGAAEIRAHALAVPVMVTMMGNMAGRGREYAISVLAVIYGGGGGGGGGEEEEGCEEEVMHAPPEEVARAVVLALQGDCTARGRRKGAQLLKILQEYGRLDMTQDWR